MVGGVKTWSMFHYPIAQPTQGLIRKKTKKKLADFLSLS